MYTWSIYPAPRIAALALVGLACAAAGCNGDDDSDRSGSGHSSAAPKIAVGQTKGLRLANTSAAARATPVPYTPTGRIVADSGFRPDTDGFGFENYGPGWSELSAAEVEDLFGPAVCASGADDSCVLKPTAQNWMNDMNKGLVGGHCYGFSVMALRMWDGLEDPGDYGGASTPALVLFGNTVLQREIAQAFVTQFLPSVRSAKIRGTPNQVLDATIRVLNTHPDAYSIGFDDRNGRGGHEITPYAVEDKGNGQFAVLVYDNNYPKITRAIIFDRNQNTWSYQGAPDPSVEPFAYDGNAISQNIDLDPLRPGLGVHPCPFCAETPGIIGGRYEQVSLTGDTANHAHLVITDERGRRTGIVDGKLLDEIPGVQVMPVRTNANWLQRPEPRYLVPRRAKVSFTIDGSGLDAADAATLSLIGPGYSAVVSDMDVRAGEQHKVRVSENASRLTYEAAGTTQSPDMQLASGRREFTVAAHRIEGGSRIVATVAPGAARLELDAGARNAGATASVGFREFRASGEKVARQQSFRLGAGTRSCRFQRSERGACRRRAR